MIKSATGATAALMDHENGVSGAEECFRNRISNKLKIMNESLEEQGAEKYRLNAVERIHASNARESLERSSHRYRLGFSGKASLEVTWLSPYY